MHTRTGLGLDSAPPPLPQIDIPAYLHTLIIMPNDNFFFFNVRLDSL